MREQNAQIYKLMNNATYGKTMENIVMVNLWEGRFGLSVNQTPNVVLFSMKI